jgi:hypothetical protein
MNIRTALLAACLLGSFAGAFAANLGCAPVTQAVAIEPAPARDIVRAERFELTDHDGRVRAVLALNKEGVPVLDFVEKGGQRHAGLSLNAEGRPILFLADKEGRPIWKSP